MPDLPSFPFPTLFGLTQTEDWNGNPRDDKGTRAALRRLLTGSRRARAVGWMALGSIGAGQFAGDMVAETVAGIYGLHPKHDAGEKFNFGCTCRLLRREQTTKLDERAPFDQHFRRLLGCRTKEDACDAVRRIARMAASAGVAINFRLLYHHLRHWENDWPRKEWTRAYFTPAAADEGTDAAAAASQPARQP